MTSEHPKISLCALALPFTNFKEDLDLCRQVGAAGIGLDETKLATDEAGLMDQRSTLTASGIKATICAPAVLSILPRDPSRDRGPRDPSQRIELIASAIDKLAAFGAQSVFCATGPQGDRTAEEARAIVIDALRLFADRAKKAGTKFAVEPMREPFRPLWTIVNGLGQLSELLAATERDDIGIVFDTWHMWDSPNVRQLIPQNIHRFVGVQIADYRDPPRAIRDRVEAGEGIADIRGLIAAVRAAGFDGWYDMEVFSDVELEGSLWRLTPREFCERQVHGFLNCWA